MKPFKLGLMKPFALTLLALALGAVSSAPAQSATPLTINVISLPSDTAGTLYYADELGYFKAAGLDVKITDMTASPPIVAAVASGAGDIGFSVVTSTAVARERGIPVRFIAPGAMWLTVNGTAQLVVAKDSTLQSGRASTARRSRSRASPTSPTTARRRGSTRTAATPRP